MFLTLNQPPQWLLDGLLKEESNRPLCPDCGVKIGEKHSVGCDVARCLKCGGQRLGCRCKKGGGDIWTGVWPGVKEAHERKYITYDTCTGLIMFDLNRVAAENAGMIPKGLDDKTYAKHTHRELIGHDGWNIKRPDKK